MFLAALGADYSIFLSARAREESRQAGTRQGTLRALTVTGGVITAAGLILAATFAALAQLPSVSVTEVGTAIAIGVLLDTLLVRTVLVPAALITIGDRIWWPGPPQAGNGPAITRAGTRTPSPHPRSECLRRGQDHHDSHLRHPDQAGRGHRASARARRHKRAARGARRDLSHRPVRHRRPEPYRHREPRAPGTPARAHAPPPALTVAGRATMRAAVLRNTLTMAWRAMLHIRREPELATDAIFIPVLFTLFFTYLFGGALSGSPREYLRFLLPGTLVLTVLLITVTAGVSLNTDRARGTLDRFRSMPIWQPSVIVGGLIGDMARYVLATCLVLGMGLLMGYRPGAARAAPRSRWHSS